MEGTTAAGWQQGCQAPSGRHALLRRLQDAQCSALWGAKLLVRSARIAAGGRQGCLCSSATDGRTGCEAAPSASSALQAVAASLLSRPAQWQQAPQGTCKTWLARTVITMHASMCLCGARLLVLQSSGAWVDIFLLGLAAAGRAVLMARAGALGGACAGAAASLACPVGLSPIWQQTAHQRVQAAHVLSEPVQPSTQVHQRLQVQALGPHSAPQARTPAGLAEHCSAGPGCASGRACLA